MNSRLSEIAAHLKKASRILLCGHILPDGIAGAVAAWAMSWRDGQAG